MKVSHSVVSSSLRAHGLRPTRLLYPCDSPGKNTVVGCLFLLQCIKVKSESEVTQSCPALCEPMDCGPLGSSIHVILQARILQWVAFSFSNAYKWKVKVKSLSPVQLFASPWTAAYQAPLSMWFSRQEYWSGLPFPSPADLPHPGIKPRLLHWRQILYCLSHQGSPKNKQQVVMKGKFTQSCPTLCDPYSLWTVACQAPLSIEFSRPEHWSGYPIPSPGDLPDPRNQTRVSCIASRFFTSWATRQQKNRTDEPISGQE